MSDKFMMPVRTTCGSGWLISEITQVRQQLWVNRPLPQAVLTESIPARITRRLTQFFLNPQQLIVLRYSIAARSRPGLDLTRARTDGQIGDE